MTSAIAPYSSNAGIGWHCGSCSSTWSGALADHVCSAIQSDPTAAAHNCAAFLIEVRLSDCPLACKVHRCEKCGAEQLIHVAAYGVGHSDGAA